MKNKELLIQLKADIIADIDYVKAQHAYIMPVVDSWTVVSGYLQPVVLIVWDGVPNPVQGKGYAQYNHLVSFYVFIANPNIKEDRLLGQDGTGGFDGLYSFVTELLNYVKAKNYSSILGVSSAGTVKQIYQPDIFVGVSTSKNQKNMFAMSGGFQMSFLEYEQ